MEGNLSNVNWFYLVPILFFGPIFLLVFYNFGFKLLFKSDPEGKALRRQEQEQAERINARRARKSGSRLRLAHPATKPSIMWVAQGAFFILFAAVIGLLSSSPTYRYFDAGNSILKLSISHPGKRKEPCIKRSREELSKLAPNMRAAMKCSRERWPVLIELDIDGSLVFRGERTPAGLSGDMASSFYERFVVPYGQHTIAVRMNDDRNKDGFTHSLNKTIHLDPSQNMAIGFNEDDSSLHLR